MSDGTQGADGIPAANTVRWTARRKVAVLRAAAAGQITAQEIARRYAISPEELDAWSRDYAEQGLFGLQAKGWMTRRRQPPFGGRKPRPSSLVQSPSPIGA